MKKLNIAVVGANGKMGQEILELLKRHATLKPQLAISREGKTQGFAQSAKSLNESSVEIDVVVEFSSPEMLKKSLQYCLKKKIPLVVGVTGLSPADHKMLKASAQKIAILYAPNMSLGVALLKKALELLSEVKDFDFQIVETHHRNKKDKPSGTANALQKTLEQAVRKKVPTPLSLRLGGVIGDHQVTAASEEEILTFEHRALSRRVFARGALRATEWIVKHSNGYFEMEDVLKG
jgi:4-hydroxy-tetrahydrodipicolinate reductase